MAPSRSMEMLIIGKLNYLIIFGTLYAFQGVDVKRTLCYGFTVACDDDFVTVKSAY